jgi:hypothetical protein
MAVWSEVDGKARHAVVGIGLRLSLNRTKPFSAGKSDRHAEIAADLFLPL